MRFLMIISGYPPWKSAGMERTCARLSLALVRRGHPVTVLTQATGEPEVTDEEGVRVARVLKPVALGPLWGITYMAQVRRWMRRLKDDWELCVCHKLDLHSVAAAPIAQRMERPCLSALYNAGEFSDFAKLLAYKGGRHLLNHAMKGDGFLYLSQQSRRELIAHGASAERVFPFRAPVYTDLFQPGPLRSREQLLFAGRFHEQKNLPLLVAAFDRLAQRHGAARLRLIGKGPDAPRVNAAVASAASRDRIEVQPWSDDIAEEMRTARAFVLSSRAEGLANVLVEAMASGTPCVCTDVSGAREALGESSERAIPPGQFIEAEAGLIVPPGDDAALAHAMERILGDDPLHARLSIAGRHRAESLFSEETCAALLIEAAEHALRTGKAP